jgi:hypothetical protein
MNGAGAMPFAQDAFEVQQATGIDGGDKLGAGRGDAVSLEFPMAAEMSENLTAKVPPKPQHSSERTISISFRPSTWRNSFKGSSRRPKFAEAVAGSVVGHRVREASADLGDGLHLHQKF